MTTDKKMLMVGMTAEKKVMTTDKKMLMVGMTAEKMLMVGMTAWENPLPEHQQKDD